MTARRKRQWFDDDTFWRDFGPFLFSEQRLVGAEETIRKALTLTRPPGKAALDLCCGPGRHAVALAKAGFKVTGVDLTKFLLNQARARARTAKVQVEWIQRDMRDFVRADAFDLVLSMYTSFGYFDDTNEDLHVLRNILSSLKPGGVCLIDVMGKEILARDFEATRSEIFPDGTKLIQQAEPYEGWSRIRHEWMLIRKGRTRSFEFHTTLYSGRELRDRMKQAGFNDVRLYGSFDSGEYGPKAQRLIAVARKPRHSGSE